MKPQIHASFCDFLSSKKNRVNEDPTVDGAEGNWRQRMFQKSLMAPNRTCGEMSSPSAHKLKYYHHCGVNTELEILI